MIQATNLTKVYGGITVLDIPHISIANGESFGLVGNNGAGKTTFFRLILDLIAASSGEVLIEGEKVVRRDEWKSKVGSFLDEGLIDFTPDEYFNFTGKFTASEGIWPLLKSMQGCSMTRIMGKGKLIRDLSRRIRRRGIAALLPDPQVLILDEPFTAQTRPQIRLKRMLNELQAARNMTMLISSHDLNHVTEVCSRIIVLDKGVVVRDMRPMKIR